MAKLLRHFGIKKSITKTITFGSDVNNSEEVAAAVEDGSSSRVTSTFFTSTTSDEFICLTSTSTTTTTRNKSEEGSSSRTTTTTANKSENLVEEEKEEGDNNNEGHHYHQHQEQRANVDDSGRGPLGGAWPPRATSSPGEGRGGAGEATAPTWEPREVEHHHHGTPPHKRKQGSKEQVIVFEDYSDPFDVQILVEEKILEDDDYTEPDDIVFIAGSSPGHCSSVDKDDPEILEEIVDDDDDDEVEEDYDSPWEWLPAGKVNSILGESHDAKTDASIDVDDSECNMTGRQRHIYETAFDSTVKHTKIPAELEDIANHPILRNSSPLVTPKTTPKMPVRAVTSRDMPVPDQSTPKERRKVTLIRDGYRQGAQKDSLISLASDKYKERCGFRTEQVRAMVHAPPRSANSTPLISHRFRHIDSAASSAKSTPTHYTSAARVRVEVPVKPLSDLSLSSKSSRVASISGFQTLPHLSSRGSAVSPRIAKPARTEMVKSISSEETLLSNAVLKTFRGKDFSEPSETEPSSSSTENTDSNKSLEKDSDPRPADDYDPPWEFTKKKRILPFSFSLDSTHMIANNSNNELSSNSNSTGDVNTGQSVNETGINSKPRLSLSLPLKPNDSSSDNTSSNKKNLALNFGGQSQKKKLGLQLNFGCAALSVVGEKVDPAIPLERQGWYHGSISRIDAENVLRVLKEGSYLIRNSESNKQDYSLSLRSARGFMHMKIVNLEGNFILGQFSKPFNSIPEMIHHYSINKLPIKGAEHMSLLYPVIDQLL